MTTRFETMLDPRSSAVSRAMLSLPEWAITHWPGGVGRRLRAAYWGKRLGSMGAGCVFDVGVMIHSPEYVHLGPGVWLDAYTQIIAGPPSRSENMRMKPNPNYRGRIGEVHLRGGNHVAPFCVLQGHGGLWIGKDTGVAAHSAIYTLSNHYRNGPEDDVFDGMYEHVVKFSPFSRGRERCLICAPVVMEDGSGLGLHGTILPGSTVRSFTWVGVGGVVCGELEGGGIAVGNPAKIVKKRWQAPS